MPKFQLIANHGYFALADSLSNQQPLKVDFLSKRLTYRWRHGGKKELLLKAVAAKPGLKVWDCTAGLGSDSFLLAAAGCEVTLFERSAILHLLLKQGLLAAKKHAYTAAVTAGMHLHYGDAKHQLTAALSPLPDVIYLDPMFPTRQKTSQVNGSMQMLQRFLGTDRDWKELLVLALESGCARIVIKKPTQATAYAVTGGWQPAFSYRAKANQFDVFLSGI